MNPRNTRREFLRDLGIGAAALPFVLNLPGLAAADPARRKQRLVIMLPPWVNALKRKDNWEAGPWDRLIQARGLGEHAQKILRVEDHF